VLRGDMSLVGPDAAQPHAEIALKAAAPAPAGLPNREKPIRVTP
jgi:hypothetical protein